MEALALPPDILLVDDRAEQRLALATLLSELEANVVEAGSGREALRLLLQRDFAVILLDVNMPDLDGFETAALIRARPSSAHTPIIFVTAYGDDAFALRGYSLGAVDYIMTPIDPQVLKTKVTVFVELFRKNEQLKRQAASLESYSARLQRLAAASVRIHAARSIDELLEATADGAAGLVGAGQVATSVTVPMSAPFSPTQGGLGGRHELLRPTTTRLDELELHALARAPTRPLRMSCAEVAALPDVTGTASGERLPLRGWLAAPLTATDGHPIGWLQLSDKAGGEFSAEDELLLVQLAQTASVAAENIFFSEAREANRIKDQFLATLSHELRSPLQAILTWACLLREDAIDSPTLARGLQVIERSARQQTRLIEDLLDVSRIVTGKLVLERRSVRIDETLRIAVEDATLAAEEKQIELVFEEPAPGSLVRGDPHRLRQVLGNLISNGIKFTPSGGRVALQAERSDGALEIRVRDTGQGIAPAFLPHLFEPFRQADGGSTRRHAGLGIGLAIVRHLVELQGGTVRAESDGEGRGSTFVLRFPLDEAGAQDETAERDTTSGEPQLQSARVLVVDDEPDARTTIELVLKQYGAVVVSVESVAEALAALERESIDALVSDLAMPGEDGFSLIRKVRARASEPGRRLPALALSAHVRAEEREEAALAGFDLHLPKPIEPLALAGAVERLLRRSRVDAR
jgi:signal transduction histidine kinase/DNA-binding response OmpR family regulator